ncbi:MAG TPA: proprotein convertase P-domain-containing protein [Thermoanaerobaculia bacterium]|nr:proprotein convertase P-domain-containing protein [Thermoanaerobaculia bacterium]
MTLLFICTVLHAAGPDLRLELVRESLTGTHYRYRQYAHGFFVAGGEVNVSPGRQIARRIAHVDEDVAPPLNANAAVNVDGIVRYARRVVVEQTPFEKIAYYYDAETNELLRVEPLYSSAAARVFDPNPVVALNDPSLQDRNDAASAIPATAYRDVDVPDVLDGPNVTIVDRELPATPRAPGAIYDRDADGFEDVNAYFHIDANQRYLQSLGYAGARGVAVYAVPVDTHAAAGADNSYFIPDLRDVHGTGALFFGEGGTDDAEDADLIVHEYGHAVQNWISPNTFTGAFESESRALSEGISDYWAFSAHYAQRIASGRDPFCFADWDTRCWEDSSSEHCAYVAGANCLRRVDSSKTMADYSRNPTPGTEHVNGEIWSSAMRELFLRIGKRAADTVLIESLFGTPPNPTFASIADRMIDADRLLFNGTHGADICAAMTARGIATSCGRVPRGELTRVQSLDRALPIPDNDARGVSSQIVIDDVRAIEKLAVHVEIAHPSRGDLRIALIAPDGTRVTLQNPLLDRAADLHATYGIDAQPVESLDVFRGRSAQGTWTLSVVDTAILDVGTLRSWSLVIQFAGDAPSDVRPTGAPRQTIPVIGSVYGAGALRFSSDVRLFNPRPQPQRATLIFTRGDGAFAAVNVNVAPKETIALDDIVVQTFYTTGIGQLEIIGDVVATSRAYSGHAGQSIRAFTEADGVLLQQFAREGERSNVGVAEIAGHNGIVRIGDRSFAIEPFGHLQTAVHGKVDVEVASGDARIVAYASTINNANGDPIFIPGVRADTARTVHAPAIANANWATELWGNEESIGLPGFGGLLGVTLQVPPGVIASERIVHNGYRQYVPFSEARTGTLYATGIENNATFRTNIGVIGTVEGASARVTVLDAAGRTVRERTVTLHESEVQQFGVEVPVTNGSAIVEVLSGSVVAYASVVDNNSGDASFLEFAVR